MQVRSRSRAIRYRLVSRALNGRFLRVRNRSEYPVQEKNPKGEIHEDEGFFSFDRTRKRLVLRQFPVEGFVNQYVQDVEAPGNRLVFTTESIENIRRARARARRILSMGRTSSRRSSSWRPRTSRSRCTRARACRA